MTIFEIIYWVLMGCIVILAIRMAVSLRSYEASRSKENYKRVKMIDSAFGVLNDAHAAPKEKAVAASSLISNGGILVHIMVNKGQNYNDKKQMESFCASLTEQSVSAVKKIQGKPL